MTLFIDASALVAMIADEPDGAVLSQTVRDDNDPLWSAMSCWETMLALRKLLRLSPQRAREETELAASALRLRLVEIDETERSIALDAYDRYGKGRHKARLNMGDCFAYACAKANGAKLLYKGEDFIHTDLA